MNLYQFVLEVTSGPQLVPLSVLSSVMAQAIEQMEELKIEYEKDPAILLLGAFIAFHTHADVNTHKGYRQLINECAGKLDRAIEVTVH